jgi:hypothetical protein
MGMACAICENRRPRRFCPGVRGEICAVCCGTEREVTVDCPLDCEYLQEARKHERPAAVDPSAIPNRDIEVSKRLIEENEALLTFLASALVETALSTASVIDYDIREALDALARTYRTLQSGIYYETRPANPLAAAVFAATQRAVEEFRNKERQSLGMTRTRDLDVLGLIVFLQRLELDLNNGRRRGRVFIDYLRGFHQPAPEPPSEERSSLILP